MAFRLKLKEPLNTGIRRVIREQVAEAFELGKTEPDLNQRVRAVRRVCKRLRGIVRLIGPRLPAELYQESDARIRDAARLLSGLRDAAAISVALERVVAEEMHGEHPVEVKDAWQILGAQKAELGGAARVGRAVEQALSILTEIAAQSAGWPLAEDDFSLIKPGLKRIYKQAKRRREQAEVEHSTTALHRWRKPVKYHWFHLLLLEPAWPAMLRVRGKEADRLGEILGDDHDCAVLEERLAGATPLPNIRAAIASRRKQLQSKGRALGIHLFAEQPDRFAATLQIWWDAARIL